jgi:hypothetical protein
MFAMKTKVTTDDEAGMHLEILPVSLADRPQQVSGSS